MSEKIECAFCGAGSVSRNHSVYRGEIITATHNLIISKSHYHAAGMRADTLREMRTKITDHKQLQLTESE